MLARVIEGFHTVKGLSRESWLSNLIPQWKISLEIVMESPEPIRSTTPAGKELNGSKIPLY